MPCFFLMPENSKLNKPFTRIIAPKVMITDLRVNPGKESKRIPTTMVTIPLIKTLSGLGLKNNLMVLILLSKVLE